jgi:hypothetical protein
MSPARDQPCEWQRVKTLAAGIRQLQAISFKTAKPLAGNGCRYSAATNHELQNYKAIGKERLPVFGSYKP